MSEEEKSKAMALLSQTVEQYPKLRNTVALAMQGSLAAKMAVFITLIVILEEAKKSQK